jgi:hypothetical protein
LTGARREQLTGAHRRSVCHELRGDQFERSARRAGQSEFEAQLGSHGAQEPREPNRLVGPGRRVSQVGPRGTLKLTASALLAIAVKETLPYDYNPSWL